MKWSWKTEAGPLGVIAAMWAASAASWARAPERLPVHWNLHGVADRWGGRAEALLILPLMVGPLYLLLTFLPRLDPGRANYERFAGTYRVLRLAILLFMAVLHAQTLAPIYGIASDVSRVVALASGMLLILLGGTMGKLRPNWFVGIRTPWTLSSKVAWVRTHRLGGWLFVVTGLAEVAIGVLAPKWAVLGLLMGLCGSAAIAVVYSYLVWRSDPRRVSPADTAPAEDEPGPSA